MNISANADQIEFWNGPAGDKWVANQARIDRQIGPFGAIAIAVLGPGAGERVLEIGCGCGTASLQIATAVAPGGTVTGLDISAPMLARARAVAAEKGIDNVEFIHGDAAAYDFEAAAYDAVFSRFGVMFFADPAAAFGHIRGALKAGGRLAFVCWQGLPDNPWAALPMAAVGRFIELPPAPPPGTPGPFAFGDRERLANILGKAGFTGVAIEDIRRDVVLGDDLAEAVAYATELGPASRLLADADEPTKEAVRVALGKELGPATGGEAVTLPAAVWLVTARNRIAPGVSVK